MSVQLSFAAGVRSTFGAAGRHLPPHLTSGLGPAGAARILADVGDVARFADRNGSTTRQANTARSSSSRCPIARRSSLPTAALTPVTLPMSVSGGGEFGLSLNGAGTLAAGERDADGYLLAVLWEGVSKRQLDRSVRSCCTSSAALDHGRARHSSALDARLSVSGITSITCSIVLSAISPHFLYGSPFA